MKNGTGSNPTTAAQVLGYGRLPVTHTNTIGPLIRPLDETPTGSDVTAIGTITSVTVRGTDEAPRAFAILTSSTGTYATLDVPTERYLSLFGLLVQGDDVEIRGTVRQPFPDWPPLIDVVGIEPLAAAA